MVPLREVAGRLQAQVKQTTQAINRLHNLLARAFPERATLEKIPYLPHEQAEALHQAAQRSVASLRGAVAEALVRELVTEVRHSQNAEKTLRQLLTSAFAALPRSPH